MSVHKFTGKAEGYSKFRPRYPGALLDYLTASDSLKDGSVIADVGAGTGILTGQLLDRGFTVLAVEPNGDMRRIAERDLGFHPAFRSINGTAENTTLPNGSVDLVTVAQAFHWFDRDRFQTECRRILKPGAKVALVWNSRIPTGEIALKLYEVCSKHCPTFVGFSGGIETMPAVFERFFRDGRYDFHTFPNDERHDIDGFIGRTLSGSYAPAESDRNYRAFVAELTELFERHQAGGVLTVPAETHSYLGCV